jgi:hypothetical protein
MRRVLVLLASLAAVATACGGGGERGGSDANEITVHGSLVERFDTPCDEVDPDEVAATSLEFVDVTYKAIGTAQTEEATLTDEEDGCVAAAQYEVTLPRVTYYQVRIPGRFSLAQMSFSQLEAANFEWNFE